APAVPGCWLVVVRGYTGAGAWLGPGWQPGAGGPLHIYPPHWPVHPGRLGGCGPGAGAAEGAATGTAPGDRFLALGGAAPYLGATYLLAEQAGSLGASPRGGAGQPHCPQQPGADTDVSGRARPGP